MGVGGGGEKGPLPPRALSPPPHNAVLPPPAPPSPMPRHRAPSSSPLRAPHLPLIPPKWSPAQPSLPCAYSSASPSKEGNRGGGGPAVDGEGWAAPKKFSSLKEFYAIIYPLLQQLEGNLMEKECKEKEWCKEAGGAGRKLYADDKDAEREDVCRIFLETCTKMILPNCNHAMCINCYRNWMKNSRMYWAIFRRTLKEVCLQRI